MAELLLSADSAAWGSLELADAPLLQPGASHDLASAGRQAA